MLKTSYLQEIQGDRGTNLIPQRSKKPNLLFGILHIEVTVSSMNQKYEKLKRKGRSGQYDSRLRYLIHTQI